MRGLLSKVALAEEDDFTFIDFYPFEKVGMGTQDKVGAGVNCPMSDGKLIVRQYSGMK